MSEKNKVDPIAGVETTGHEWDGIRELDNPLPRWWLWVFYATILFSVGYMILYPSIPLGTTYFGGTQGYSQRSDVAAELAATKDARGDMYQRILNEDLEGIRHNDELLNFSLAGGRVAYLDNCAACHGTGATGGPGYPNLADDDWLWGGDLQAIHTTITHGIRWTQDDDTRYSEMPNFGAMGILGNDEIEAVAEYVLSLSGLDHDQGLAQEGAVLFEEQCVACHGEGGVGNKELGAPALNDQVWLYAGNKQEIMKQLNDARHGQMPAWTGRLDEATIKMLTVYVHSLGGGE